MSVVKSLLIVSKCYEIVQLNSIRTLPDLISLISFIVLPFTQLWASSNIILSSILLASSTSIPEKRTEPLFIRDLNIIRILWVNRIFPFDIALPIPPRQISNECKQSRIAFSFSNRQHSFSGKCKCTEILCAWCELSYVPVSSSHHFYILR